MEVTYNFANGENVIVSVDEKLGGAIMQLDKDLYNNNQKETRRHQSLNEMFDKSYTFVDKNVNIEDDFLRQKDVDKLHKAILKLKPSEQELIHKLYLSEHPMTQAEYAKYLKIQEKSVQEKSRRIRKKLERLLKCF